MILETGIMINNLSLNMGYNKSPYMILPLDKVNSNGMKVESTSFESNQNTFKMNTLDDIKAADTDKNNIITLKELQNFDSKTDFARMIMELMESFASKF